MCIAEETDTLEKIYIQKEDIAGFRFGAVLQVLRIKKRKIKFDCCNLQLLCVKVISR